MESCDVCGEPKSTESALSVHALMMHTREERKQSFPEEKYQRLFVSKVREKPDIDLEEPNYMS